MSFYKPAHDSPEMRYLHARRAALGGSLPIARAPGRRRCQFRRSRSYARFALQRRRQGDEHDDGLRAHAQRRCSRSQHLGPRVVPIVADEARTFGMANLFRQVGIYSSSGQRYEPEDIGSMLTYREARDGQILEEGITEAGALSSLDRGGDQLQRARPARCCRSTSTTRCSASSASAT